MPPDRVRGAGQARRSPSWRRCSRRWRRRSGFIRISIGLLTPPLGVCLFVVCSISRISLERMVRAVLPFLLVEIGVLLVVSYIPWVVLVIPKLLGYL